MARTVTVYRPSSSFPSVSVTGQYCSRSCAHCNGRYLMGMADVSREGSLYDFGKDLEKKGGRGMLVSGGCDPFGRVPLDEPILDQVRKLKDETSLLVNMHVGLVTSEEANSIFSSGVDVVSYDVIGNDMTIKEVLGLDRSVEDYDTSYGNLVDSGLRVVPHILAGFHFGELRGEFRAIDLVMTYDPGRAVLILLIPTKGTPMEHSGPLPDRDAMSVAATMRKKLRGEMILGCMRPKGNPDLEISILEAGFDGIVLPASGTTDHIKKRRWTVREEDVCCAADPEINTILF